MKKTYGTYKGRSTLTDKLRVLAVVLLILVVLAAAAVFAAQDYIVYTEDGPRLQLPGFLRPRTGNLKMISLLRVAHRTGCQICAA